MYVYDGTPDIRNNEFRGNCTGMGPGTGDGGAICALYGSPIIRENVICFNDAGYRGGGIFCEHSEPTIVDNHIYSNVVLDYYGGGIASRNCTSIIERNIIHDNYGGDFGGGLFY
ncbi:right-handed parallel beta-helix repeat-containing protein [Candidatus Eisenbacteria bacterium]|uniref:Right-handed parallel beta-helix repeat-containing protein n=1 Tax=Eiseniibacteriota bacterium TaxID=2212470 RepID=A0ABV6YI09_UNCEI